jgi:hypothetical protein
MNKINNTKLKLYYQIDDDTDLIIYDSNKKYFDSWREQSSDEIAEILGRFESLNTIEEINDKTMNNVAVYDTVEKCFEYLYSDTFEDFETFWEFADIEKVKIAVYNNDYVNIIKENEIEKFVYNTERY